VTFRDGLLKARGQITFVVALALSTGIIIYLEALDTEDRIRSRVEAELSRQRAGAAAVSPSLREAVGAVLSRSEADYARDPAAAANQAALLAAVAAAVQLGATGAGDGLARATKVLDEVEQRPGVRSPALASALGVTAAVFPTLQERVARVLSAP
jgi:hypothetical protein